ncbi:CopG family transcriptional regulator [Shewanella intestini]|uniref:CopG family transcriptional regulator n=1 Tax=Shewanella intestini TaxID=2017544 RepID=A0ABS5I2K5_9GAMM|nr:MULTISPECIES: CopG family transcriptional regulator [Shewanella]MBR9728261.1 hypothetical protein [Shewanella intestini]MRG35726.1 hypothetical protein [Shewanella sp. XMDDZSB0408]
MGLADLKKNASSCNRHFKQQMTIDEFIETANLYAAGKTHRVKQPTQVDNVTSIARHPSKQQRPQYQCQSKAVVSVADMTALTGVKPKNVADNAQTTAKTTRLKAPFSPSATTRKPFRRSTFTLSEMAISQLKALSQSSNVSKSKLIRQLVDQHFSLSPSQREAIEASFEID